MEQQLKDALKRSNADYADVRVESDETTQVVYRGEELDTVSSGVFQGGIARACKNGGWGIRTFDSPDEVADAVAEASQYASLIGNDETVLANVEPVSMDAPAALEEDFREVSFDDKVRMASDYNDIILQADPRIESSTVSYGDRFRRVYFASTRGTYFMEERPRVRLHAVAVARDGDLVQRAQESVSSCRGYGCVRGLEHKMEEAAHRAVNLLEAPPCEGGVYPVILDPELAGVFAHEAFGHLSEADGLYENPKMRDLMYVGREMGAKGLNIVDDGSMPGMLGSSGVDDEGTPTGKTDLIREGVLAGHLHGLETAGKMKASPTGNARAIRRDVPPIVRMTNTYIEGGDEDVEEMIGDIDDGIYACSMQGGQTMMEMFTFSAGYAYRIRNGQVGELIRDVTLTGNVFETLQNMDGFGNDFRMIERGGGCGKGGQSPLPVTFGAPHLRIQNVVVGGR